CPVLSLARLAARPLALFANGLCRRLRCRGCGLLRLQRGPPPAGVPAGIFQVPGRAFGVGFTIGSAWRSRLLCCSLALRVDFLSTFATKLSRNLPLELAHHSA